MSLICILAPVVVTSWPAFSAVIASGAAAMGFSTATQAFEKEDNQNNISSTKKINLEIPNSDVVFDRIGRNERILLEKDGIKVIFGRDIRNRVSICVQGEGYTDEYLRQIGEDLSKRIVQEYVYQKIMANLAQIQGVVVEESREEDNSIRIKVRTWQ